MVEQLDHQYLEDVAANSGHTIEELTDVAETLTNALQANLANHFERSQIQSGRSYWLLEYDRDGVWLAFTRQQLVDELRSAGYDVDPELVYTVSFAYLLYFQDTGKTIKVPGIISRSLKEPFIVPIYVPYPEAFLNGMRFALLQLQRYLQTYRFSAAEALDYWATQRMNQQMSDWAAKRHVGAEAVRKNVRQARVKLEPVKPDRKSGQKIQAVSVDEIPDDKPHDEGKDVFYIPDQDSLEGYSDAPSC